MNANPSVELRPVEQTHLPSAMSGIEPLVAVNSALEVDLSGQVNAEVAGDRYIGAVGGHVDFFRAAAASEGGLAVLALPSRAGTDGRSRIVPRLTGPVTTSRADIAVVVTEHGAADLRGLSLEERALALVGVAHPEHRSWLSDRIA